jgi:uncharacterized protein
MESKIVYFEQPGPENTAAVFDLVDEAMAEEGITKVLVASTRGDTARYAMDRYRGKGVRLIILPHQYGTREEQRFPRELVERAEREGHVVHFGTMLFAMGRLFGFSAGGAVADFLRVFCQGFKVCVELVLMVGDAGLVALGEKVVVVSGTGRGADTAMIATGADTCHLKQMHVSRILCKPL